jgi:glycosyltransferase involved in cell wall biosynthesis
MRDRVEAALACPDGELASAATGLGVPVFPIRPVSLGFRVDALATAHGLSRAIAAAFDIASIARRFRPDVIHANSVRAGMAAIGARVGGAPAPLVHVRDALPPTTAGRLTAALVTRGALLVLANSRFTAGRLCANGSGEVRVVYNSVDFDRFRAAQADRAAVRRGLSIEPASVVLGVVAQLTPWKAQDDAIRTLALVRRRRPGATLLLVGKAKFRERSTSYDNVSYEASLHRLADSLGLDGAVQFLGERRDLPELLCALDVLLVPSWEEPFGRSVIEAMAAGTPVVATSVGGPSEVINDGETGLLVPPRRPERWAEAVLGLLDDPERADRLARHALESVQARFGQEAQVGKIAALYREAYERSALRLQI